MTSVATLRAESTARQPLPKRFVMCRPDHFEVTYCINPWMDPEAPVDRALALDQWERLRATYQEHGHKVDVVPGVPGLPDMVFAANGGLVIGDRAMSAKFTHAERAAEGPAYHRWFAQYGLAGLIDAQEVNEGEGDFLLVGERLLAGMGFRSSPAAHQEVAQHFSREVISLELVDPRFYHLDTVLLPLDATTIAYFPPAFSAASQAVLAELFPDAIVAIDADAEVLGLNGVSDGFNVFLSDKAVTLSESLRERGFNPIGIDMSELLKAGGSVKCCTLEIH
ncbi:dimethylargininase [Nocardia brasiliensis]|uniref:dimethylargininase n=1 Tax=Nocardia brasiliensis TaxID=37326 RepID=UPI002454D292|nr:dimethylargininase [Nocardia brasiliensis]